jgi:lipopolysaccharide/colanic/teichoic acid biosynthesis glycosyltransferase
LALVGGALIFAVVAAILRLTCTGPLLFRHERVGFQERTFSCLKFRTMVVDSDSVLEAHLTENAEARAEYELTRKLRRDPRIVPIVGRFLRQTSLDELPQFINVLRGEMSIVGPRPVTRDEIPLYGAHKSSYLSARPGITGLWQVSGRNMLTFAERVSLDARYADAWSMRRDMAILLRTCGILLTGKGAY